MLTKANFVTFEFSIYNRWGEQIFISATPEISWEGNFNAEPAETGTCYYYLKAETNCGKITKKGDITLVR